MSERVEVAFREVERFIRRAFPGAKSRKTVKVSVRSSYSVSDYWDGGSRDYSMFVNLRTGEVRHPSSVPQLTEKKCGNPFGQPMGDVALSEGFAIVEECIFRGKSLGFRIYLGAQSDLRVVMGLPALAPTTDPQYIYPAPQVKALPEPTLLDVIQEQISFSDE